MIAEIQKALRSEKIEAWLFFDHHRRDSLAYRVLRLPDSLQPSRRWFYLIPAEGEAIKIVHRIESGALDSLPGKKVMYASWAELSSKLGDALAGLHSVAMQYSPDCNIPYISLVDAGTVEFVRSFNTDVLSSANLIQEFESRWTQDQFETHIRAGQLVDAIRREAFDSVGRRLKSNDHVTEFDIQQFIRSSFERSNLSTDHGTIVAVNANASDPHYEPTQDRHSIIRRGDLLLIDLWAKINQPDSVYYDVTWTAYCGTAVPGEIESVFDIVRNSRINACAFVKHAVGSNATIEGWQVDDVARGTIMSAGFGDYFFHRTGHSIGTEVHGTGANMDNLESHDERKIIPGTCFSVEPGIYLPTFGIRSEVNVFVSPTEAMVTGEEQDKLVQIEV